MPLYDTVKVKRRVEKIVSYKSIPIDYERDEDDIDCWGGSGGHKPQTHEQNLQISECA